MKFCEKIKEDTRRSAKSKTNLQKQSALLYGQYQTMRQVSLSKKRETYYKMAEVLKVDVNYLPIGDEEFLMITGAKYVNKETKLLISEVTKLFSQT